MPKGKEDDPLGSQGQENCLDQCLTQQKLPYFLFYQVTVILDGLTNTSNIRLSSFLLTQEAARSINTQIFMKAVFFYVHFHPISCSTLYTANQVHNQKCTFLYLRKHTSKTKSEINLGRYLNEFSTSPLMNVPVFLRFPSFTKHITSFTTYALQIIINRNSRPLSHKVFN